MVKFMSEYKTVLNEADDEFVVKKSRFIGYVKPVRTADEAVEFINSIKSKHWDATHNVYAYVLRDGQTRRYSDDGEPQGTAGIPVLDVLLKEELTDVCVVATRYFGGIMLGDPFDFLFGEARTVAAEHFSAIGSGEKSCKVIR